MSLASMSATTRSRSSADTSGSTPNHLANAGAAWCEQHAEPVDGLQPASLGGQQQRRLQRDVDDVGDDRHGRARMPGSAGNSRVAMHAERSGVHQQIGIAQYLRQRLEPERRRFRRRNDPSAPTARSRCGWRAGCRAIPARRSASSTARAAPPAPDAPRRVEDFRQAGANWSRLAGKAVRHRCCRPDLAVIQPEHVDGAGQFRRLVAAGDAAKRRLLVRDGDIAAGEAGFRQVRAGSRRNRPAQCRSRGSCHRDAVGLQPVAMDHRRARMRDRVAADEGLIGLA